MRDDRSALQMRQPESRRRGASRPKERAAWTCIHPKDKNKTLALCNARVYLLCALRPECAQPERSLRVWIELEKSLGLMPYSALNAR